MSRDILLSVGPQFLRLPRLWGSNGPAFNLFGGCLFVFSSSSRGSGAAMLSRLARWWRAPYDWLSVLSPSRTYAAHHRMDTSVCQSICYNTAGILPIPGSPTRALLLRWHEDTYVGAVMVNQSHGHNVPVHGQW